MMGEGESTRGGGRRLWVEMARELDPDLRDVWRQVHAGMDGEMVRRKETV